MISPITTLTIQTLTKKVLVIYALNSKKNYTKYTNYIMQNKKIKNQILKLKKYKDLLTERKP